MATTPTTPSLLKARLQAPSVPVQRGLAILAGSFFVALCSHITVPLPFTPVPLTMQPFAVLLLGLLMGPSLAAAALVAYLVEGAAGLPVFTPGAPGMAHLLGPTGGYLLSYPFAAALAGLVFQRHRTLVRALAGALLAEAAILLTGASWLAVVTHRGPHAVLSAAVLPFLPGDTIKIFLAAALATIWARRARSQSSTSLAR